MHTPPLPFPQPELHALALDGVLWRDGSVIADSASPPLHLERAALLAERLPDWAIAAGHTAGWVWTGLGHPEPWSLFRPLSPSISPLARAEWKPRSSRHIDRHQIGALYLLSAQATIIDLLTAPGDDDVAASQLFALTAPEELGTHVSEQRRGWNSRQRDRARVRVARVRQWWRDYPDVTR